jgi:hypothetical protein
MSCAGTTHWREDLYKLFIEKHEGKRPLGISRRKLENNDEMGLRGKGYGFIWLRIDISVKL